MTWTTSTVAQAQLDEKDLASNVRKRVNGREAAMPGRRRLGKDDDGVVRYLSPTKSVYLVLERLSWFFKGFVLL